MPLNMFKVKKYAAFFIVAFIPMLMFYLTLVNYYNFLYAVGAFLVAVILTTFIASRTISHPLLQLVEGSGILALDINSTGVIRPFICQIIPPFVRGKLGKTEIVDAWDRDAVFYLTNPKKGELTVAKADDGELYEVIVLGKVGEKYVDEHFGFEGFPTLIYNRAINTFLTKSALAKLESESIVKHVIFYLNKRVEELTAMIRDFARYVVEQTKPRKFFGLGNYFWLILVIGLILIFLLLMPAFLDTFTSMFSSSLPPTPVQPQQPVTTR